MIVMIMVVMMMMAPMMMLVMVMMAVTQQKIHPPFFYLVKICCNEEGFECDSFIFKTCMITKTTIGRDGWTGEVVGTKKNCYQISNNAIIVHLVPSMIMVMVLVS